MSLPDLPRFSDPHNVKHRRYVEGQPGIGHDFCAVLEFGSGLALSNAMAIGLLWPFFPISAFTLAAGESSVLFGVIGLLVVVSRMGFLDDSSTVAFQEGELEAAGGAAMTGGLLMAVGVGLGIAVGTGLGIALCHLFDGLELSRQHAQAPLDHLFAGTFAGAVVGMIGGGVLILAGGTPNWKTGRFLCAVGRFIPTLLRAFLFPRRKGEVQIAIVPWLEAAQWVGLVAGPLAWLLR